MVLKVKARGNSPALPAVSDEEIRVLASYYANLATEAQ